MNTSRESLSAAGVTRNRTELGYAQQAFHAAERQVQERPVPAVAALFAFGVGAGLCLGLVLAGERARRSSAARRLSERLGQAVLGAVANALPDSLRPRATKG